MSHTESAKQQVAWSVAVWQTPAEEVPAERYVPFSGPQSLSPSVLDDTQKLLRRDGPALSVRNVPEHERGCMDHTPDVLTEGLSSYS